MMMDFVRVGTLRVVEGIGRIVARLRGSSAPLLGARWVEVSREVPSGDPLTFERTRGGEATREIALHAGRVHRIPHPLGRVPEGIVFAKNSGGLPVAEGEHTASHLTLIPAVDTSVRLAVL